MWNCTPGFHPSLRDGGLGSSKQISAPRHCHSVGCCGARPSSVAVIKSRVKKCVSGADGSGKVVKAQVVPRIQRRAVGVQQLQARFSRDGAYAAHRRPAR